MELPLHTKIESYLFFKGEPVSLSHLSKIFNTEKDVVLASMDTLRTSLSERGIVLVSVDNESVTLGTHPTMADFFRDMRKEELSKELTKPSLETLSIILYKEDVSRADIDYIRGVNSSFILRNLSVRGLIEKTPDSKDSRKFVYRPTLELLAHLGVRNRNELPSFDEITQALTQKIEHEEV